LQSFFHAHFQALDVSLLMQPLESVQPAMSVQIDAQ
jgi:hypothetical protein